MTVLTKAEAKTRWCPFARVMLFEPQGGDNSAINRDGTNCNCIASGCMAWRVAETAEFKAKADDAYRMYGTRLVADTGYCGLAGRPS